ncbi:PorT family protein [Flavobacterium amniphilum]|uniref:outer membrane beta-barrel protein n=1 Tax=Flavobacterium amniphilum TaxID=1834035 RepID=UPI00202AA1AC|nr:outer membrane beta-barrel protein [Flavobacterium amniphilum]MCL9804373.1 PorT family protein [Flavobacterium amniphilum]
MKKIIALTVLFVGFTAFSQKRAKGTVELTPFIGHSSSNYYGEEDLDNSSMTSVHFGADLDYFYNDRWSFRSGMLFQTMGTKFNGYREELNYVTIPLNANWHFGSTRKWNLNFGPSIGFLTSANGNGEDIEKYVNSTQIGLNYGIGYKLEVSKKFSILFDYQGMTGLSEVPEDSDYTIKNSFGSFNIGGVFVL